MDRRTLTFLAVGIVLMMGIVAMSGSRGLPRETKELVARKASDVQGVSERYDVAKTEIEDLLSREPELFRAAALDVTLPERLSSIKQGLDGAQAAVVRAQELVEKNERDSDSGVLEAISGATGATGAIDAELTELLAAARLRVDFKDNLSSHLDRMRDDHRVVEASDISGVDAKARRATIDWPAKSADLSARLQRVGELKANADEAWRTADAEGQKRSGRDYEALIRASDTLALSRDELSNTSENLGGLVDQLYTSWDKILADMEINEGREVSFRHKYDVVKVQIKDAESHENETTKEELWVPVNKSTYDRFEQNLGMTVERKAAGKYDSEAESIIEPAGLAYIASPEEGRNQYGEWRRHSGGNFWVFYGQYALMRDLLWGGGGYRPIGDRHWRNYDSSRRAGRTFYGGTSGGKQMYGSKGTVTSSRYAGSKYQRTGGFKNSQYKKSGGAYRGSRYASGGGRGGGRSSRGGRSRFGGGGK